MLSEALLAVAFQIGPFYEQKQDAAALRPFWADEGQTTDVVWPLFTSHSDWWRFAFFTHWQSNDKGYQFDLMPLGWYGTEGDESYWGLFPLYGSHPHILLLRNVDFALWPLWMRYQKPRSKVKGQRAEVQGQRSKVKGQGAEVQGQRAEDEDGAEPMGKMTTNAVLWPFFHWRDDGSWGFWPLYVCNHQRESFHQTALWPIFTWASYERDRDTGGAGSSWMVWPLCGGVTREREDQWLCLPPLFSVAETRSKRRTRVGDGGIAETGVSEGETNVGETGVSEGVRYRLPWPIVEYESVPNRTRLSIFPLYEKISLKAYSSPAVGAGRQPYRSLFASAESSSVMRFGWKLVELYSDETRVFPFWVSRRDDAYFRLWPFCESVRTDDGAHHGRFFSLYPIRHVPAVDRNWAKFWTFYEREENPVWTGHSLFWGIIRWRTIND